MDKLVRASITIEKSLLENYDRHIKGKDYPTRSKAIGDLIREELLKKEWKEGKGIVAGAITIVYSHHKREMVNKLMAIQHDFHDLVVSTQHVHLDHHNCLEIIVVKGKADSIENLANRLKSTKGVRHSSLTMASTGREA